MVSYPHHPSFKRKPPSQEAPVLHFKTKPHRAVQHTLSPIVSYNSVTDGAAISPKDSTSQSPAQHDHPTKSPFLFLYHFIKKSLTWWWLKCWSRKVYLCVKLCGLCLVPKLHLICRELRGLVIMSPDWRCDLMQLVCLLCFYHQEFELKGFFTKKTSLFLSLPLFLFYEHKYDLYPCWWEVATNCSEVQSNLLVTRPIRVHKLSQSFGKPKLKFGSPDKTGCGVL